MKIDPIWEQMIQTIEPEISELRKMIDDVTVIPVLYKRKKVWRVTIEVHWPDGWAYVEPSNHFDIRCKWVEEQLKSWPDVSRQSYEDWDFKNKRDAEKFLTLYNLVWA